MQLVLHVVALAGSRSRTSRIQAGRTSSCATGGAKPARGVEPRSAAYETAILPAERCGREASSRNRTCAPAIPGPCAAITTMEARSTGPGTRTRSAWLEATCAHPHTRPARCAWRESDPRHRHGKPAHYHCATDAHEGGRRESNPPGTRSQRGASAARPRPPRTRRQGKSDPCRLIDSQTRYQYAMAPRWYPGRDSNPRCGMPACRAGPFAARVTRVREVDLRRFERRSPGCKPGALPG